jgi:phenylacetate-CoA ligase
MNWVYIKEYLKSKIKDLIQPYYLNRGNIRNYQLNRINEIVKYAKTNSPFYKGFYKNINLELKSLSDIKKLPILKKEIFKQALKKGKILSKEFEEKDLQCGYTTGSTGMPLKMCFDKECIKKRSIVQYRLWKKMNLFPYKRFVKIWRDKKLTSREKELQEAGLLFSISVGDVNEPLSSAMTNEKLQSILEELINFKPQVIRGYVSALYSIANLIEQKDLKFNTLESVITSAEYLPENMWKHFEKVFNCPVYNLYGGTEAPAIAVNDFNSHNMIISEDLYYIEVLDENGNDVKPGEPGIITITDLYSKAMPLIRYQIGDIAIVDGNFYNLSNEFRYFKSVEGRTNDIFELDDGKIIYSHVWYIYFRNEDWIEKFQVIQKKKNLIEIKLLVKYKNDIKYKILKQKIESLFPNIKFIWSFVDRFELQKGCKFRAIISEVPNKFNLINKG